MDEGSSHVSRVVLLIPVSSVATDLPPVPSSLSLLGSVDEVFLDEISSLSGASFFASHF